MTGDHQRLSGAWNFRDVAETATIAPGRLFRSSELSKLDESARSLFCESSRATLLSLRSLISRIIAVNSPKCLTSLNARSIGKRMPRVWTHRQGVSTSAPSR